MRFFVPQRIRFLKIKAGNLEGKNTLTRINMTFFFKKFHTFDSSPSLWYDKDTKETEGFSYERKNGQNEVYGLRVQSADKWDLRVAKYTYRRGLSDRGRRRAAAQDHRQSGGQVIWKNMLLTNAPAGSMN